MHFEWDENKNQKNIRDRGLDFADAQEMFEGPMLVSSDDRKEYGEIRQIGIGYITQRLMVVAFTQPAPDVVRVISLRKANTREQSKYEQILADRLGSRGRNEG